jgi:hypothetical protein
MHERRRLECVPGSFATQIVLCEATQFVIDGGHQFVECRLITHGIKLPQKGTKSTKDVAGLLCGPLRLSAFSAFKGALNAENAEGRREPQRTAQF